MTQKDIRGMSARELALDVLMRAESTGQYSNIIIDRALDGCGLNEADRRLFTATMLGVIERRITLDYYINALSDAPERIDLRTRTILRIGLYQLMFMDRIPEYAAINETVALAQRRTRGFVNAVLRGYLRGRGRIELPSEEDAPLEHMSVKYSFPEQMCKIFTDVFGCQRAERIFDVYNRPSDLTLRINTLMISREEYAKALDEAGIDYEFTRNSPCGIRVAGTPFGMLPHFEDGFFFIQDEASQICVEAFGAKEGYLTVDCCACPGSKSFGAAINMNNRGRVISRDIHKSKLSLINDGAERLGIDIIDTSVSDAREVDESLLGAADLVICDAPCSGLGVIGKKPEIRYKDMSQSERLPSVQYDILGTVCRYVKSGGVLVYSTCTVLPCENSDVVDRFLAEHAEFVPQDFTVGDLCSTDGRLSLYPDTHGTDGFFIAKMRRM